MVVVLFAFTVLLIVVAWLQKRRAVWIASGVVLLASVLLPVAAHFIVTSNEAARLDPNTGLRTMDSLTTARDQAMRKAMLADRSAANALHGLWQHGQMHYPLTCFVPGKRS